MMGNRQRGDEEEMRENEEEMRKILGGYKNIRRKQKNYKGRFRSLN